MTVELISHCLNIGFILFTTYAVVSSQVGDIDFGEVREEKVVRGDPFNFTCSKVLKHQDRLSVEIDQKMAAFTQANNLAQLNFIEYDRYGLDILSYKEGDLMADPPRKPYSITMGLFSISNTDSGVWTCRLNDERSSINITVVGPPSEVTLKSNSLQNSYNITKIHDHSTNSDIFNVNVKVNKNMIKSETIELLPTIASTPPAQHKWFKGEEDLMGGSLELERSKTMRETYLLNTYNEYGELNVTVEIYPQYAPDILSVKDKHYPSVGDSLYINCEVDAKPNAAIFFVKNQRETWERLETGDSYTINDDGLFIIHSVDLDRDVGEYLCIADNIYGKDNRTFNIHGEPLDTRVELAEIYGKTVVVQLETYAFTDVEFVISTNNSIMEGEMEKSHRVPLTHSNQIDKKRGRYLHAETIEGFIPETEYTLNVRVENKFGVDVIDEPLTFTTASANVTRPTQITTKVTYVVDDDENTASLLVPSLLVYIITFILCTRL